MGYLLYYIIAVVFIFISLPAVAACIADDKGTTSRVVQGGDFDLLVSGPVDTVTKIVQIDRPRTVMDLKERIGSMMGTGFTSEQSQFMLGILATLVQLLLVKLLLLGS